MTDPVPTTRTVTIDGLDVPVTWTAHGAGAPMLLLHGGGGPATVAAFGARYAAEHQACVIVPVHPGFNGTPRPAALTTVTALARLYAALLDDLGLEGVTVAGNSLGGWIAAELAILNRPRVARSVIVDGVGLNLPETPIVDFFVLDMSQVADLSYFEPDKFRIDPTKLPKAAQDTMAGNREALRVYGGVSMSDATLQQRLPGAAAPALVVWGAADKIVPPAHGAAYADALPDARYEIIDTAGHLPQLETPELLSDLIGGFIAATS